MVEVITGHLHDNTRADRFTEVGSRDLLTRTQLAHALVIPWTLYLSARYYTLGVIRECHVEL